MGFDAGDVLIGRDEERARLASLVFEHRVVLVHGSAGVGKTALVLAACRDGAAEGRLPEAAHVALGGVTELRAAFDATARALGVPDALPAADVATAFVALLARTPRVVVWDDVDERSGAVAELTRAFGAETGPSRIVVVSRRFITTGEAKHRAVSFEVKPLSPDAAVALVEHLERERGSTLAEELARALGYVPALVVAAMADGGLARPPVQPDVMTARRLVEERAEGAGKRLLALLSAAKTMLVEDDLVEASGEGARDALAELEKHRVVMRIGPRVGLSPVFAGHVAEVLGPPPEAVFRALAKLAEAGLGTAAAGSEMLVLASRAHLDAGDGDAALTVLRTFAAAAAGLSRKELEKILRAVAARAPRSVTPALLLLAHELVESGDFEATRAVLDELPRPVAGDATREALLLRARCHVRAGDPDAAHRLLGGLDPAGPDVRLGTARLEAARGDLEGARRALEALEAEALSAPHLEAERCAEIALTFLLEERYELALAWALRAAGVRAAAVLRSSLLLTTLEVQARLGLGEVERAEDIVFRDAAGDPPLETLLLVRRGDFLRALDGADRALLVLERRGDLLGRALLARELARASLGLGHHARAARALRVATSVAEDPGLAVLRPLCDLEDARLAEADGELARARKSAERAFAGAPRSPFVAIERDAMDGIAPEVAEGAPDAVAAFAALRTAEVLLRTGDPDAALAPAAEAERFFVAAALEHELARARLARGEALARLGRLASRPADAADVRARADQALAGCESVAAPRRHRPILAAVALVRAAIAEDRGDLASAARAIEVALKHAGDEADAALGRAAARLGVTAPDARGEATHRPFAARVERLGLDRPADVRWTIGGRAWLRAEGDPPPVDVACHVDVDRRRLVSSGGASIELPEQRLTLLCALAEATPGGATLEEIFERVWGGEFHPLRHRNAVYVALTRLKESLRPLAADVRVAHEADRYRLEGERLVGVRRRIPA